jgi:zinc transport system substrate-binding protein
MRSILLSLSLLCVVFTNTSWANVNTSPRVVVSITPFYALVAAVMQTVGTPELLVKPGSSPHEYALRPSDMQKLINADVIFWGGPALETFLVKPLNNLPQTKTLIQFDKTSGLLLLPLRHSAAWDPDEHKHEHDSNKDMHFWLDPNNAIILTNAIIDSLIKIDPKHTPIYKKNGAQLKKHLKKLDRDITAELKTVKTIPYIVFHDAYQYFEHRYGLTGIGSITLNPEIPPSAKRLNTIRTTIEKSKAVCVFREPQFQPKLVDSIVEDLGVKTGELDPVGQAAQNNPTGYFTLLENLSHAMKQCLTTRNQK